MHSCIVAVKPFHTSCTPGCWVLLAPSALITGGPFLPRVANPPKSTQCKSTTSTNYSSSSPLVSPDRDHSIARPALALSKQLQTQLGPHQQQQSTPASSVSRPKEKELLHVACLICGRHKPLAYSAVRYSTVGLSPRLSPTRSPSHHGGPAVGCRCHYVPKRAQKAVEPPQRMPLPAYARADRSPPITGAGAPPPRGCAVPPAPLAAAAAARRTIAAGPPGAGAPPAAEGQLWSGQLVMKVETIR